MEEWMDELMDSKVDIDRYIRWIDREINNVVGDKKYRKKCLNRKSTISYDE